MDESRDHGGPGLPAEVPAGVLGDRGGLDAALARWTADAIVDEAARTRIRSRWMRIQAEEDASFLGTLVDLAERARPVVLDVAGTRWRGVLVGIGADFVALRSDRGQHVLVRTDDIAAVRAEPGSPDVLGDRSPLLEVGLAGVLGPVAADRPDVHVRGRDGVATRGVLRSVGRDVLRLRVDGDPPTPVFVPLEAVAVLIIEP